MKYFLVGALCLFFGAGASYAYTSRTIKDAKSEVVSAQDSLEQCEAKTESASSDNPEKECKSSSEDYFCICERKGTFVPLNE